MRANSFPESAGKLRPAIGDKIVQYARFSDHVIENICASTGQSISFLQGDFIAIIVNWSTTNKILVYAEEVHTARCVTKSNLTLFQSPDGGGSGTCVLW